MKKLLSCIVFLLATTLCNPSFAVPKPILDCINEKVSSFQEEHSRMETVPVGLDAPRGKLFGGNVFETIAGQKICRTVTVRSSGAIEISDPNEKPEGNPTCTLKSASFSDRTRIISCDISSGRTATLVAEAWGKGCEEDNAVVYELSQKIIPIVSTEISAGFYEYCFSQHYEQKEG